MKTSASNVTRLKTDPLLQIHDTTMNGPQSSHRSSLTCRNLLPLCAPKLGPVWPVTSHSVAQLPQQLLLVSAPALPDDRVTATVRYKREAGYSLEEKHRKS